MSLSTLVQELQEQVATERLKLELAEIQTQQRLMESQMSIYDSFVDPREAYLDDDGDVWKLVGQAGLNGSQSGIQQGLPQTETDLQTIRDACRVLSIRNEFALSGHESRINYLVGTGHRYVVSANSSEDEEIAQHAEFLLQRFLQKQQWGQRQQEIVRRLDRDGECFLRFFPVSQAEGLLAVRFVEPEQIATPSTLTHRPEASFGILTDADDVENVSAYFVDNVSIDASEIQHRKANVDRNTKRGLPLFYPVISNLQRIDKLLRNMSVLAQTQAAIAVIRKHHQSSATTVQNFADAKATYRKHDSQTGKTERKQRLLPGTILDAPSGIDYEFPTIGIDAGRLVAILQAELRAIAARLVMPEYMLSADSTSANYASTLVAEAPSVKMFQRLQATLIADDLTVMNRLIQRAIQLGELPLDIEDRIRIQAEAPSLVVRDPLEAAQANEIKARNGVLSRRTWQLQEGLDPNQETENDSLHQSAFLNVDAS